MEIGETIGKVAKLDMNTDKKVRGRFARMAVFINLYKPLISQVLVNGIVQKVEYEFLPTVCFHCGKYGHIKDTCPTGISKSSLEKINSAPEKLPGNLSMADDGKDESTSSYGPWMIVENRYRQKSRDTHQSRADLQGNKKEGSRFRALTNMEVTVDSNSTRKVKDLVNKKDKGKGINIMDSQADFSVIKKGSGKLNYAENKEQRTGPIARKHDAPKIDFSKPLNSKYC